MRMFCVSLIIMCINVHASLCKTLIVNFCRLNKKKKKNPSFGFESLMV